LELSQHVQQDLQYLAYPSRDWVPPRKHPRTQQHVYDVLVVGGGQCGLTTAFGLLKDRVGAWAVQQMLLRGKYAVTALSGTVSVLTKVHAMCRWPFCADHNHTEHTLPHNSRTQPIALT